MTATLRVLGTSDVHMHLTGWDARFGDIDTSRGFDRVASLIRAARKTADDLVLLFDNGDALQGTAAGDIAAREISKVPHPWPLLLNALDYDAVGLGNHDFDYGLPVLEAVIDTLDAPVLCANADPPPQGVLPHVILTRNVACSDGEIRALRIGLTSLLPPQTLQWNHRHLHGCMAFDDGVRAGKRAISELRAEGADVVIVLCHSGLPQTSNGTSENFSGDLARDVPGIDAMILGHTHRKFPNADVATLPGDPVIGETVFGVPAVMPGYAGETLGQIDLHLSWNDVDGWAVTAHDVALRTVEDVVPDRTVTRIAAPCLAITQTETQEIVGQTGHAFHSFFAMLRSGTSDALIASAMQTAIENEVRGTALDALPIIAAVSPHAVGGQGGPRNYVHVAKGPIRARHIAMICPFQNTVWATIMSGAELWRYAERGAEYFAGQLDNGGQLVAPDAASFNFDVLHGLDTVIDPFAPAGQRIAELHYKGQPVDDHDRFVVAMNSYRGAGGGGFLDPSEPHEQLRTGHSDVAALLALLRTGPLDAAAAPSAWSFVHGLGVRVLIETAPEAMQYLDEIAAHDPEPLGLTEAGFLRVRVTL